MLQSAGAQRPEQAGLPDDPRHRTPRHSWARL